MQLKEAILKISDLVTKEQLEEEDHSNLKESQINLVTSTNRYELIFPFPKRLNISKLILHLDFIHSTILLKERSQLVVAVNGIIVTQISYDPQSPHVIADIPIPIEYIRDGYNSIEFRVSQHYTNECEDPSASELWTQINTLRSYFYLKYDYHPLHFTLAELDDIFDKKILDYHLTIMRPKLPVDYNDIDLLWGSLVVQGASLRLDYKQIDLDLAVAKQKENPDPEELKESTDPLFLLDQSTVQADLIFIGTRNELDPFLHPNLKKEILKAINGPYIAILPAADPRYQVVLVSGLNEEEVTLATQAFTMTSYPFPDHASMVIKELNIPLLQPNKIPKILQPGVIYPFKELGFKTVTKSHQDKFDILFDLPPDILPRDKATVTFKLDLSYGAAFRKDSSLNIYLNSLFQKAIYFDNIYGTRFNDYELYIPIGDFFPGLNTLTFELVLPPLVSDKCTIIQNDNAIVSIYDTSTIELPLVDHYVKLPDFKLLNRTGFPYLHTANGEEMGIVVRGMNEGSILAAWQLLSKFTQQARMPLHKAVISFRYIDDRHLLIVGDRKSLYEDDYRGSPVQLGEIIEFDYPIEKQSNEAEMGWLEKVKLLWNPLVPEQSGSLDLTYANNKFISHLGQDTLLVGYQSAQNKEKLVILITSEDPKVLHRGTRRLVEADFWGSLDENLAVWNEDDYYLKTLQTKAEFFVGETSYRNSLAYYYSLHRTKLLVIILVLIGLLAWLTHRWLARYKQRLNKDTTEIEV